MSQGYDLARPYTLTCPECGGAFFPGERDPLLQFRCHIGHVLNWQALMEAQLDRIDAALGTAMAVMKERAELCRHLSAPGHQEVDGIGRDVLQRMLQEAEGRAVRVKALLEEEWMPIP